jgi:predicted DsbA family dithiol-disulfide isomerase
MKSLKIDFVSDIACPWCAIGLASLERALDHLKDEVHADVHFEPFELNPSMGPEGQDTSEHLTQKYGTTREQQAASREAIRQRGADVGFEFRKEGRPRIHNTFDAHRLLYWAGLEDPARQHALKLLLLRVVHTDGDNPADRDVLLQAAASAGLDASRARAILESQEFAREVRDREEFYQGQGIHAVPSVIVNDRHLIQGGQPPEVFERALRQIAAAAG